MPPFELPASVSPFAARRRRMSTVLPFLDHTEASPTSTEDGVETKRHTIAGTIGDLADSGIIGPAATSTEEPTEYTTPASSPTRSSFGFTPERAGKPSTILLKRATAAQRLAVDRGVGDIISESCATARSKAQLRQVLFLPDVPLSELRDKMAIRDSTMLRRRRSFLDSSTSNFDIAFTGEIRGSIIPIRHQHRASIDSTRSHPHHRPVQFPYQHEHARHRSHSHAHRPSGGKPKLFAIIPDSSTEIDTRHGDSPDDTVSDLGTLTQGVATVMASRTNSVSSTLSPIEISPLRSHHVSLSNLRQAAFDFGDPSQSHAAKYSTNLNRRKTASAYHLNRRSTVPNRAKSTPASPYLSSKKLEMGKNLPPLPPAKDLPNLPGSMGPPSFIRRLARSDVASNRSDTDSQGHSASASSESGGGHTGSSSGSQHHTTSNSHSNSDAQGTEESSSAEKHKVNRERHDSNASGNGPMQTLRRSMSFLRERADSFDLVSRPSLSREHSSDVPRVGTESPRSSRIGLPQWSKPGWSRQNSGTTMSEEDGPIVESGPGSGSGSSGSGGVLGEEDEDREGGGGGGGLMRKRSTRLFQTLGRFTPM